METELKAPLFPESISEGTLVVWHQEAGAQVTRDQPLADVETEKVVLEILAPTDGYLIEIIKQEGEVVSSEELLGRFSTQPGKQGKQVKTTPASASTPAVASVNEKEALASPVARKLILEKNLDIANIQGTGKGGRITKEDVLRKADESVPVAPAKTPAPAPTRHAPTDTPSISVRKTVPSGTEDRPERRVPMTRLRASIARRLVEAQQNAAMLTTFNEVNMSNIIRLRNDYKEEFETVHKGIRLGFMSFFVRASVEALKKFSMVNASLDGNEIVYHGYYDIGVAVGTPRGLVVPILKNADALSLAQIEGLIKEFGEKAHSGKLSIEEMTGGTFTISNGGVYGSLLSTPILNPPQTAILGMHKIEERPVVIEGEIKIQPMMYLALSYDHRMIDGSEAVRFLVAVKGLIEQPSRILLEL